MEETNSTGMALFSVVANKEKCITHCEATSTTIDSQGHSILMAKNLAPNKQQLHTTTCILLHPHLDLSCFDKNWGAHGPPATPRVLALPDLIS